ncbi:MAG: hypothetical protein HYX65_05700 [Gemmatimonadetes bacterium]|nr:hypothetical protein [Gemmatimonadota bacterium]
MSDRRGGIALLVVLLALATLGATAAALLASASALRDDARGSLVALQARTLAASAVARTWGAWDGAAHVDDPVGGVSESVEATASAVATVQRARLHPQVWWVAAEARARSTLRERPVRHAAALALQLAVAPLEPPAAVITAGAVSLAPGALVAGGDTVPPGWPCAAAAAGASPEHALLRATGSVLDAPPGSVRGADGPFTPASDPLPAWQELRSGILAATGTFAAAGSVTPVPSEGASGCAEGGASWGEPDRAGPGVASCRNRWVVAHAVRPLTIMGGRAQGILLADSTLHLAGGARFVGVVLARGAVYVDGASVVGAIVLLGEPGRPAPPLTVAGGASIARSRCAVLAALLGGPLLAPADPGGWVTLW